MKRLNTVLNIVLIVAVGVLFAIYFTGKGANDIVEDNETSGQQSSEKGNLSLAYVQIDTLLANMQMYADMNDKLTTKQQQLESSFASKYRSFERDVADFQNKIQKGLVTRKEAQDLEQQLTDRRAQLENERSNLMMELQEENTVSMNRMIDYIITYLEEYNSDGKYEYIFSSSYGSGILYAKDKHNITREVLRGINAKYEQENASK